MFFNGPCDDTPFVHKVPYNPQTFTSDRFMQKQNSTPDLALTIPYQDSPNEENPRATINDKPPLPQVPKIFAGLEIEQLVSMRATLTCQPPMAALYEFEGRVEASIPPLDDDEEGQPTRCSGPLGPENLVLRGARLRDTDYVLGCAVYTGRDTKLSLNSKLSVNKFSTAEKLVGWVFLFFSCVGEG